MEREEFQVVLLRSINEGISATLGPKEANALRFYLDTNIAGSNIHEYTRALRKIFGSGAVILERACVERLYGNLGLKFQAKEEYGLAQYVEELSSNQSHLEPSQY